jgi:hypothetical protein
MFGLSQLSTLPANLILASALALFAGCSRNTPPPALPADQVPAAVENAFKEASPDAKNSASEVVSSLHNKDEVKAFLELQSLSSRTDLTPEQRQAAARSVLSMNERLRVAAEQGDQRAAEALQGYRSRK